MKKKILISAMLLPLFLGAQKNDNNPCNKLEKGYQWMKDSLELTLDQQTRVTALKSSACSSLNAAKISAGTDKEKYKLLSKEIIKNYRQSARRELTPVQRKKLKIAIEQKRGNNGKKQGQPTPEKRATQMTEQMKTRLGLDSIQVPKVYTANLQFIQCQIAVKAKKDAGADSAVLKREMMECAKARRNKMKTILSAEQWVKYEAMQKEKKEKVQNKRKK
jgi:hypothetical protein